jgi:hypothetical protein
MAGDEIVIPLAIAGGEKGAILGTRPASAAEVEALAVLRSEPAEIKTVAESGLGRLPEIAAVNLHRGLAAAGNHGRRSHANRNGQSERRNSAHVVLLFFVIVKT